MLRRSATGSIRAVPAKRILVCDDDPAILRVLEVNLEFEGYDVLTAGHGERAIELARSERPDLVILDIMMPRLDGYETCRRLKAAEETKHIPVVFLTARAPIGEAFKDDADLAEGFLTKPFDPAELLEVVGRLVGGQG